MAFFCTVFMLISVCLYAFADVCKFWEVLVGLCVLVVFCRFEVPVGLHNRDKNSTTRKGIVKSIRNVNKTHTNQQ